jgi:hypothetical protein
MNESAIDDAEDAWFEAAHKAKEAERDAWDKYSRLSQGKPVIKSSGGAKPKQTLQVMPSGSGMGPMMAIMQRMNSK